VIRDYVPGTSQVPGTWGRNAICISAEAFARSPEARTYLRVLAVIAAPAAAADGVNTPLSQRAALNKLYELQQRARG
jgi:hypothetical protein